MKKTVFCKYNMNRNPLFQTKTVMVSDNGEKYIEKSAITEKGLEHIRRFSRNYEYTKKLYTNLDVLEPTVKEDIVEYPFIKGTPIEEIYMGDADSTENLIAGIKKVIDLYLNPSEDCLTEYKNTSEFNEIFGEVDCSDDICLCPCNIDMILENIIMVGAKPTVFDYEWVFDFPIPKDYVIYRVLCHIYDKRFDRLSKEISISEFVSGFGINEDSQSKYRMMEDHFVQYVFSMGDVAFTGDTYLYPRKNISDFDFYKDGYNDSIKLLHETEESLIDNINKYTETVELYNKTQKDLEKKQKDLLKEIESNKHHIDLINERDARINSLQTELFLVYNSVSWKVTRPLRGVKKLLKGNKVEEATVNADIEETNDKDNVIDENINDANSISEYLKNQNLQMESESREIQTQHKISLITPLFNTPEKYLRDLLESVVNQSSDAWELCLVNYSSDGYEYIDNICREYSSNFPNILYHKSDENKGISDNSNECASYATGDYIGVLDHDDVLNKYAIEQAIRVIEEQNADFIYSDEAKFEEEISDANYLNIKPDFSMDELRAHNFICHFNVFKSDLFKRTGGYRKEYDGSQDHDLVLRLTELAETIVHIPKVLYFWRVHANSVAMNIEAKPYATISGEKAVTAHYTRNNMELYAKSIVGGIPVYRAYSKENVNINPVIVVYDSENDEEFNDTVKGIIDTSVQKEDQKNEPDIIDARNYDNSFEEIIRSIDSKYLLFVKSGIRFDYSELQLEISKYTDRNDIATIDAKIINHDGTILSGGAYLSGDTGMPVMIRGMGGGEGYSGYENAMIYTRDVSCSTGLCTLVNRDIIKNILNTKVDNNLGVSIGKDIIIYSYWAYNNGFVNLWCPFYKIEALDAEIKNQFINDLNSLTIITNKDKFFNLDIIELKLE